MLIEQQFEDHVQHQVEIWQSLGEFMMPVPEPRGMLPLYRPMRFSKKRCGPYRIVSVKGTKFTLTSVRHARMLGVKPITLDYGREVEFHDLVGPGGTLTSDRPVEIYSQYIAFHLMRDHVLVGGLGLGMAAEMIRRLPAVTEVIVIEKDPRIIELIGPQLHPSIRVIRDDLFDHLRNIGANVYDSAYYDIWYQTDATAWGEYVLPLYRASYRVGIRNLGAWGEHEMRWQLASALYTQAMSTERRCNFMPYRVFLAGLRRALGPSYDPKASRSEIICLVHLFLEDIGSPRWEETFGPEL